MNDRLIGTEPRMGVRTAEDSLENAPPSVRAALFGKYVDRQSDDEVILEEEFVEEREIKTVAPVIRVSDAARR